MIWVETAVSQPINSNSKIKFVKNNARRVIGEPPRLFAASYNPAKPTNLHYVESAGLFKYCASIKNLGKLLESNTSYYDEQAVAQAQTNEK